MKRELGSIVAGILFALTIFYLADVSSIVPGPAQPNGETQTTTVLGPSRGYLNGGNQTLYFQGFGGGGVLSQISLGLVAVVAAVMIGVLASRLLCGRPQREEAF